MKLDSVLGSCIKVSLGQDGRLKESVSECRDCLRHFSCIFTNVAVNKGITKSNLSIGQRIRHSLDRENPFSLFLPESGYETPKCCDFSTQKRFAFIMR